MKTVKFEGTVEEYQSQKLATPIKYSGEAEQYENLAEAKNSEDWLSESEILRAVNNKRLTAAKASKYQEVTKDLKKAYEESPAKKRKDFLEAAVAGGMSIEQATSMADSLPALRG